MNTTYTRVHIIKIGLDSRTVNLVNTEVLQAKSADQIARAVWLNLIRKVDICLITTCPGRCIELVNEVAACVESVNVIGRRIRNNEVVTQLFDVPRARGDSGRNRNICKCGLSATIQIKLLNGARIRAARNRNVKLVIGNEDATGVVDLQRANNRPQTPAIWLVFVNCSRLVADQNRVAQGFDCAAAG